MTTPSMSMFASQADYRRAMAQRDQSPHQAAVAAMWLWGKDYAISGLGSMGYWDSLSDHAKDMARRCAADIVKATQEDDHA